MARNVIICLDGTGNQFEEHNSNIVRLFRALERNSDQAAYYDPGVGTLSGPAFKTSVKQKVTKTLGLAFGRGLLANVEQAYSYLMEHYQDGDRIFFFGFSRGAYTARVLAGFIHHCGLLEPGCQNLIPYALRIYTTASQRQMHSKDWRLAATFRKTYGRRFKDAKGGYSSKVDIDFLGLFDSVSTFGWAWDPVFLPHTSNNPAVQTVRHALAIDERRLFFRQLPWGMAYRERQDVKEVWFAGVHSDVGGGYPENESGLAKVALQWMIHQAKGHDLKINDAAYRRYVLGEGSDSYIAPDALADPHRSLKGAWWPAELAPKRVWDAKNGCKAFRFPKPNRPRWISQEPRPVVHSSVIERMESLGYAPSNLPPLADIPGSFEVEDPSPEADTLPEP